jgi:AraC-like DNA-binding protein
MAVYYNHLLKANRNKMESIFYAIGVIETTPHVHHEAEMAMVLKGRVKVTIDDISYLVSEGGMFFINPMSVHSYEAEAPYAVLTFLGYKYNFFDDLFPAFHGEHISFFVPDQTVKTPLIQKMRTLMLSIYKNFIFDNEVHNIAGHSAALLIALILRNNFSVKSKRLDTEESIRNHRNSEIEKFVTENFDKDINIHSLAEYIHLSSSYVSHYFKDTYKITFHQYLTTFRVLNAKYLLRATDLPITEIAFQCGFDSSTDFSRVFKKNEKLTPSEYRNLRFTNAYFSPNENGNIYTTRSGFYIAFSQEQHVRLIQQVLQNINHNPEVFDFFTQEI